MKTFYFLWQKREKPTQFKRLLTVIIKRLYYLFAIFKIINKSRKLSNKGAQIGRLTIIGKAKIEGHNLTNLSIGEQTSIGQAEITLHDSVKIGDKVVINDGVKILTGTHRLTDPKWGMKSAPVLIADYVWIATNAIVLPGVTIGRGAVIGAGAVVREDVTEYQIVVGNPAQVLDNRKRTKHLDYSPVLFNAPYEAWIGRNLYAE